MGKRVMAQALQLYTLSPLLQRASTQWSPRTEQASFSVLFTVLSPVPGTGPGPQQAITKGLLDARARGHVHNTVLTMHFQLSVYFVWHSVQILRIIAKVGNGFQFPERWLMSEK